jgi:hypothetical protein
MTAILAYLPFNHLGDVLFILYSISEIVALEGNEIAQNLKDFLVSNGFSDADIDPNYIDHIEKAAAKKNPTRTKTLAVMSKAAQFDSSIFSQLCFQGCSLSLLVRLYFYLLEVYKGVSEKRLVEYEPSEKERINDRGTVRSTDVLHFDSKIPCARNQNGLLDKDNLVRQYAIFRSSMRKYDRSFNIREPRSDNEDTDHSNEETNMSVLENLTKKRKVSGIR